MEVRKPISFFSILNCEQVAQKEFYLYLRLLLRILWFGLGDILGLVSLRWEYFFIIWESFKFLII